MTRKSFYIDGAGCRPDGSGSGYAWVCPETGAQRIWRVEGLTNNEAEYRALLAVLKHAVAYSRLLVFTDSLLVCQQFNRKWKTRDPDLRGLLERARELVKVKELEVEVRWIPRDDNFAGKVLDTL